jgi:hypothetical protein
MSSVHELRSAERAFLDSGDERYLDQASALAAGDLRDEPFAPATQLWIGLLRYDRGGDGRHLDTAVSACQDARWRDPGLTGLAIAVLLRRWARDGDGTDLDRAIELGHRPTSPAGTDLPLWQAPAWRMTDLASAYLERYRFRDTSQDLHDARELLRGALRIPQEPVTRALVLRHLAACEQELYLQHGSRRLLSQAIRRYERALAMVPARSVLRPMLLTELGTALQDRYSEDEDRADICRAVALAAEAVKDACGPDSACHLVNLGTALITRYERLGDPLDLDAALQRWGEAVDALPAESPYRPGFLDRLAFGLIARWDAGAGSEEDLNAAIGHSRAAVQEGAETPTAAVYASQLADALQHRWELHRDPSDLAEAVSVLASAVDPLDKSGATAADLTVNLAYMLLARYEVTGDLADVRSALAHLASLPAGRLSAVQRATVHTAAARALSMRYQAAGNPADLAAALAAARRGLAGAAAEAPSYSSRAGRLASLLFLRYLRHGQGHDLNQAIQLSQQTAADEDDPLSTNQLSQLSIYLSERYERDGDPADRDAAITLSRRAWQSDRRDSKPTLDMGLATALHGRFLAQGRLDELDETITRHRSALARESSTAPWYPTMLSNLAIALQDKFVYEDDSTALDEAVSLHERAVADCPATAPDRPGYLATLAAAVQLRFERDRQMADLDQAISLYDQALAVLGPRAPERAVVLTSLAAAQHLHAAATGDRAEFDDAVGAFRTALRLTRRNSTARPAVLRGYAGVLADSSSRFPAPRHRATVRRAFERAISASEAIPVERIDTASAFGEWALQAGLWAQAADAYRMAADARRALFGAQIDRLQRDSWLRRGDHIAAAEAFAWARCDQPGRAVVALDGSRALGLSEALDAGTLADRLRTDGRPELARRYRQVMQRLATPSPSAVPAGASALGP